ncbi:MAG: M50 family metallopeptidase [Bacteroidales bacterium]|nr:M50 family metallopeptidase [Bacteroidales bacterium]
MTNTLFPEHPWMLPLMVAIGFVLPRIPLVGKFFNVINTALHEFGHALVALLFDGQVKKIDLNHDASGTTTTSMKGKFPSFLCALAGYPCAISVAWLSVYLLQQGAVQGLIIALSALFFLMLVLWIRNVYGVLWVLLFLTVNGVLLYHGNPQYLLYAAVFYVVMMVTESVYSVLVLFYLSIRTPQSAGDATNLAKLTHVPAFVWSLLFMAYVAFVVYKIYFMMF